jgi:hypothetical protein
VVLELTLNQIESIWDDEISVNSPQQKYKFCWDAEPKCCELNIDYNTVSMIEPFKPSHDFRDYLLDRCNGINNKNEISWSFDIEKAIDEILSLDTASELAIDRQLAKTGIIC